MTGWPREPLRALGTWYGGGTPSKSRPEFWRNGSIPWLSPKDMGPDVLSGTIDHITEAAVAASSTRLIPAGSVAVVARSGILERTLPVAVVPFATTVNQDIKALSCRPDVDPRWAAWGLRASEQELLQTARKAGTTVASLEWRRFLDWRLPVPPIKEQQRIIEILEDHLSRLDAANDYLDAVARRLRSLEVAVLHETVESTAERVHLRDLVARVEAGRSFGGAAPPAQPDEWGVIKVSAMTWGEFQPGENKAVPAERVDARFEIAPGDLLVSRANTSAYVGASVLVRETRPKLLLSDKSLRLVPQPGVDTEWLHLALSAPGSRAQISSHATGTKDSMRNISQASLLSIEVPQASFDEQRAQVSRVRAAQSAIRALALAATEANARAERLRRGLLSAAFSGRLAGRSSDLDLAEEMTFA